MSNNHPIQAASDLQRLQEGLGKATDGLFGASRSPLGPIAHLKIKLDELSNAASDPRQYAACLMLLLDAHRLSGGKVDDLVASCLTTLNMSPMNAAAQAPRQAASRTSTAPARHVHSAPAPVQQPHSPSTVQQQDAPSPLVERKALFTGAQFEEEMAAGAVPPEDSKPAAGNIARLTWALMPEFNADTQLPEGAPLLAFDGFMPSNMFEICKGDWAGYVMKGEKKVGVYNTGVIASLKEKGIDVVLDGVAIDNACVEDGFTWLDRIIGASGQSTNPDIARMAQGALSKGALMQKEDLLKGMFEPCHAQINPAECIWEEVAGGALSLKVDIAKGICQYVSFEGDGSGGAGRTYYFMLKQGIPQAGLQHAIEDINNFTPVFAPASGPSWTSSFNGDTYEAKRARPSMR